MTITFPFEAPAIRVVQPIGTFYVTVLPAELLLKVSESDRLRAELNVSGIGYHVEGTQRQKKALRLREIAKYLARDDSAFPNSIIIAANFNSDLGMDQNEVDAIKAEDADRDDVVADIELQADPDEWSISENGNNCYTLRIPKELRLATIIDGQHRLYAFADPDASLARLDMDLICAVFLDLPKPLQAQIFATINSTQKPVDRSLTYELFGYNIEEEAEEIWTPDKLAVYLTRKLATDSSSPMFGRITVAPKQDIALKEITSNKDWKVSTAVVVDGILRLITTSPKRDSNKMHTPQSQSRDVLNGIKDTSPLREVFIAKNDLLIYRLVENYLSACNSIFWRTCDQKSFIRRTVGIQALFDILRKITPVVLERKDLSISFFERALEKAGEIDFSKAQFKSPSGSGRILIRKTLEESLRL